MQQVILENVAEIISDLMGVDASEVKLESDLMDDLAMDSLDIIYMTIRLEEKFSITIPDIEVEKFVTVEDVVKAIKKQRGI